MSEKEIKKSAQTAGETKDTNEQYSLSDDRRVKVLSPGALVAKRFFRNRLAVTGMVVLIIMFLFSFLGGVLSPYLTSTSSCGASRSGTSMPPAFQSMSYSSLSHAMYSSHDDARLGDIISS